MKTLSIALLLGVVSTKNLVEPQTIWDEASEEVAVDICSDHWKRWDDPSNSFDVYAHFLTQNKMVFQDKQYEANMDSIYSVSNPPVGGQRRMDYYNNKIKGWMRPHQIYPEDGQPSLLGEFRQMKPQGIKQGSISDCWFLSTAASLVEQPWRLNRVIHANSRDAYNPQGIFRYYFWNLKKWVPINIDDRFPVKYKYTNSEDYFAPLASDKSSFGAWWIPLLEKAYAKLNGNLDRIEWGNGYESLRQLSNKPAYHFTHKKLKKETNGHMYALFHKLAQADYPMVTSCCGTKGNAPDGLVNKHAYTLLDVVDVDGHRLAKIRNPWGKEGYNGKWSDSDPVWTPEMLKKAGHTLGNDGVFYMPFQQFIQPGYFKSTAVAIHKPFTKRNLYMVNQEVEQQSLFVTIPSKQVVYFTLEKENPRFLKNCEKDDTFVNIYFFKGKSFPGMDKIIGKQGYIGDSLYHNTLAMPDFELDAGEYTIYVVNWNFSKNGPIEYSLQVYQEGEGRVSVSY